MNFAGINFCGLLFLKNYAEETFAKSAKNRETAKVSFFKVSIYTYTHYPKGVIRYKVAKKYL